MNNHDLLAVRRYVTAETGSQRLHDDTVLVDVTHSNLQQRHLEIRLSKRDSVDQIRTKIHQQTGTSPSFQVLQVLDSSNSILATIPPECTRPVGYYIPDATGYTIHCIDTNPMSISRNGALENTNLVDKYVMTEETYDQRQNTLRSWKRKEQITSYAQHAAEHAAKVQHGERSVAHCRHNDDDSGSRRRHRLRCEIQPGGRRGTVQWVGTLENNGYYVGVALDEPVGKHDGVWKGVRYFTASPRCGVFCRGSAVSVGDYPERDIFDDDDESDDDEL